MTRKEAITISCPPDRKEKLEALALKYGFLWGDKPNISEFIRAIADGDILLADMAPDAVLRKSVASVRRTLHKALSDLESL